MMMKNIVITFLCCSLITPIGWAEANNAESNALVDRGWALENQGKHEEALELYNQALALDSNNYLVYKHRGTVFIRMENYEQAEREFERAIALEPAHASSYYNRGILYYRKGDYDKAIRDYSKAIEFNPNYANAILNRAAAYTKKGEEDKADADYALYAKLNPQDKNLYPAQRLKYKNRLKTATALLYILIFFSIMMQFVGIKFGEKPSAPPLTEPQQEEIKRVFKVRQKRHWMLAAPVIIFVLLILILANENSIDFSKVDPYFLIMGFLVFCFINLLLVFQNWRCPWCNKYFGRRINLKTCPHCGVSLK